MQQSIRQNASEISDALSDLKAWGNEMEKKEKKKKINKRSKKENEQNELPPIRNSMEAKSQLKKNVTSSYFVYIHLMKMEVNYMMDSKNWRRNIKQKEIHILRQKNIH